ncbi:hypothetical protein BA895_13485 [Humibacillus sp. DSM 29435]|nr:hypothetical protein BA895_13485 [Humibacillus sp. DSM 29435]
MVTNGIVRQWHDDQGWGVIDSLDTPGGCWAHFSSVETLGYRRLPVGQRVTLEFEDAEQDGFAFRARHVRPSDETPWFSSQGESDAAAYSSTLTIRYPDPTDPTDPTGPAGA